MIAGASKSGMRGRSRFERDNRILALLLEVGPDIAEISRRTGIPAETVRYLYREHIVKRRIRVQRELDYSKLGLEGVQFMVTLNPEIEPLFAREALLCIAWEEVYVKSIYRIVPDNLVLFNHMAPPSLHKRLGEFYTLLEDLGVLKVQDTFSCTRLTHPRTWVEEFNLELPGWDFDWSSPKPPDHIVDSPVQQPVRFDRADLSLVEALHNDCDQTVAKVAGRIGLTRSVAFWHFREHVKERGILGKYLVNWIGTHRDPKTGTIPLRQSFVAMSLIAKSLSNVEMMTIRARLHSIPYLWSEMVGATDYIAEVLIPAHSLMDAFAFFSKVIRPLERRARLLTSDLSYSSTHEVAPHLFDDDLHEWAYKGDLLLRGIKETLTGGTLRTGRNGERVRD